MPEDILAPGSAPVATQPTETPPAGAAPAADAGKDPPAQDGWLSMVGEDLRSAPSLSKFKDVGQLAASYVNLEKHMGSDKIAIPNAKTATDKDWEGVFTKLGRPESPDKYEVKPKEGVDVQLDDNIMKGYREAAHKAGLLPKQVQQLFEWYSGALDSQMKGATEGMKTRLEEGVTKLKSEWGDNFQTKAAKANVALKEFGDEETFKMIEDLGLANHPAMVKLLNRIGEGLSEDKFRGEATAHIGLSIEQAEKEIATIMSDPKHAYFVAENPQHDYFVKHVMKLREQVSAGRKK